MTKLFFIFIFFITSNLVYSQTPVSANVSSSGWKRVAYVNGLAARGFGKVTIYTTGGSLTPYQMDINWFKDWGDKAGISVNSNSISGYWTEVRLTYDADTAYLEVNFTRDLAAVAIISDEYGWNIAKPIAGSLPRGSGTERAKVKVGKLAVGGDLTVAFNGNVGIGTQTPTSKLSVNGPIRASEIKVEASPWPDFVFKDDYDLPTLQSIKKFIDENGHLPEVPTADQVEKEGVELGKFNAILLKKVEELTLHLIQKDAQLLNQVTVLEQIGVEIELLKAQLKDLKSSSNDEKI